MKILFQLCRKMKKKGLSNMVAYALLISITITLSIFVYAWLRFFVGESEISECSSDVNVVIQDYGCLTGPSGHLNMTLKNKGLFNVDGFILRVHDRPDADFGFYTINDTGTALVPGQEYQINFTNLELSSPPHNIADDITLLEVQPFLLDGESISCKTIISQKIDCMDPSAP